MEYANNTPTRRASQHLMLLRSHLLPLLLDEEHEPELEEGVGLLVGALAGELLVVGLVVAGPPLDHVDPGHGEPAQPGLCHPGAHHQQQSQHCPHVAHTLNHLKSESVMVTLHDTPVAQCLHL